MGAHKGLVNARHPSIPVEREVARRVVRFVLAVGERTAVRRLGVGKPTLDAAREHGAMMPSTYARLRAALDRVEAEDAASALAKVGT